MVKVAAENILEIRNLSVSFGARRVVDDVSLSLKTGEITALVGESGSGKTLVGLSILDLAPRTSRRESGSILFSGKNIFELSPEEKRKLRGKDIGMVFQEPFTAFNPVMSVGDQIEEAVRAHFKLSSLSAREKVLKLLEEVKLSRDVISRYPHELSGGMRQRALLAMAISCGPRVLILDEPTTAVDVTIQKHILELIKRIQSEKDLAVLFITHDFSVVNLIADTVAVMQRGVLVERGRKNDMLANPVHPYTRELISCIPRLGDTRKRLPVLEGK